MSLLKRFFYTEPPVNKRLSAAVEFGQELGDHPDTFILHEENLEIPPLSEDDIKLVREVARRVPELRMLQETLSASLTDERFWGIFMVLFKQHMREPTKNVEAKENVVQIVQPEKITVVPLLNAGAAGTSVSNASNDSQDNKAKRATNQLSQTTVKKQNETGKQKVLAVICTLCRKKFETYDLYRDHLPECTKALSGIKESKSPVIPKTKISKLNRDEWRTAESVVLARILGRRLTAITENRKKVHSGVSSNERHILWETITGCTAYLKRDSEFYERSLKEIKEAGIDTNELYVFDNVSFKLSDHDLDEKQIADVKSILAILHYRLPANAYLPYLPDMVCTVRSVCDAVQTCAICWIMAKNAIDERTFALPATYSDFESYQAAFGELFKIKCPSMATRFEKREIGVGELFDEWLQRLFVGYFPPKVVRRMFDFILCDGIEAVCRFGVTMLGLLPPDFFESRKEDDEDDYVWDSYTCYTAIQERSKKIEFTKFFDVACTYPFPVIASRSRTSDDEFDSAQSSPEIQQQYYEDMFLPENPSALLSDANFAQLWSFLPLRYSAKDAVRRYYTGDDGFSFHHLVEVCDAETPLLLIIRSLDQCIFGAYLSDPLVPRRGKYFGTGEAFLFSLSPKAVKYPWAAHGPGYFILLEHNFFAVGGGNGYGLTLDEELHYGTTESCDTFQNEPLNGGKTKFECSQVEVLGFVDESL